MSNFMAVALVGVLTLGLATHPQQSPAASGTQTIQPDASTSALSPPEVMDRVAPSIVQVLSQSSGGSLSPTTDSSTDPTQRMGSGVAVPGGIVSSDRVVGDADRVVLVASNGRRSTANVVRRAPARDLVLLA